MEINVGEVRWSDDNKSVKVKTSVKFDYQDVVNFCEYYNNDLRKVPIVYLLKLMKICYEEAVDNAMASEVKTVCKEEI